MKRDDFEPSDDEPDYEGESWRQAALSPNHPDYLSDLEELKRNVDEIAVCTNSIILYRDKRRNRIEIGLFEPRHKANAINIAARLGQLLEAPVRVVDAPEAGSTPDVTQKMIKGDPAHKFYRGDVTFKRR